MEKQEIMLRAGDYYIPTKTWQEGREIFLDFPFNRVLLNEIKAMEGRKYYPEQKIWSILDTPRNEFAMEYLKQDCEDPYNHYDKVLQSVPVTRPLWPHQRVMLDFFATRRSCLLAAEQGTGKSLPLIEFMERGEGEIWYVSTTAGLEAMRLEFEKWESSLSPKMFTYEGIKKPYSASMDGYDIPRILIGDESSRLKTSTTARSRAFKYVADSMRACWGEECAIILCTGTPAPHSPVDWWMQCEISCPGFLKESTASKFKSTLANIEYRDRDDGGKYPFTLNWWDNESRCSHCGQMPPDALPCDRADCQYTPSINEIHRFYERASGLVLDMKKEDCLDLPDKHYKTIRCTPTKKLKKLAKELADVKETKIELLSALRCLSDGHQYTEEIVGEKQCPTCKGLGEAENYVVEDDDDDYYAEEFEVMAEVEEGICWMCEGSGVVPKIRRSYVEVDSPKLEVVASLLSEQEDVGRIIIYAAYHASIDRIEKLCLSKKWSVMKVDGRGWYGITPSGDRIPKSEMVKTFQQKPWERNEISEQVVWLAHPESSGTGLTLTESPTEVFYSNSFKADDRLQAEDRAHRPGMDLNKGLTVIDIVNLETDALIFDNLANKRWLQDLTMGRIKEKLSL